MQHPDERSDGGPLGTGGHPDEGMIHAWLDGALSEEEGAALELHAAACADCRGAIAEARGLIAASSRIVAALDAVPAGVIPVRAPAAAPVPVSGGSAAAPIAPAAARPHGHRSALRWSGRVRALAALALVAVGATLVVNSAGGPRSAADMLTAERSTNGSPVMDEPRPPGAANGAAERQRTLASELGVPDVSDVPASPRAANPPAPTAPQTSAAAEKVAESAGLASVEPQRAVADAALPEPAPVPVPPPLPLASTAAPQPVAATSDAVGRAARQESRTAAQRGAVTSSAPASPAAPTTPRLPSEMVGGAPVRSAFAPTPSLAGQVLDNASGTPVAGAIVSVEGAESTALTDQGGRFTLQRIPSGSQTALVRRAGFETARVPVEIPDSAGSAAPVVVRLRPTDDGAGELTVTEVPVDPRREGAAMMRARQFADCYRLEVIGRAGPARDAVERALPGWLTLTLEPTQPAQWFRAEARAGPTGRRGYWRAADRQRIELIWVAAPGELRLRLGGSSARSELTGRATWAPGAAVSASGGADVRVWRTGCDLPPG